MSVLTRYSAKLNGWNCADGMSSQHTYILMPNESQKFYSDLERGHDSDWSFLTDYVIVRAVLFDGVAMQWVFITRDSSATELRLEIVMGSVRNTVITVMQRWSRKLQHDGTWSVLVLGNELCSDVAHHTLIAWATLFEPAKHTRFTGETVSLIRLCSLTIIQDGTLTPSALTALSPLSTQVEWNLPPVPKLVTSTKRKLLQTKFRRSRIGLAQRLYQEDQTCLPI